MSDEEERGPTSGSPCCDLWKFEHECQKKKNLCLRKIDLFLNLYR